MNIIIINLYDLNMYCRVTEIKFDYTKREEVVIMLESLKDSMKSFLPIFSLYAQLKLVMAKLLVLLYIIQKKISLLHPYKLQKRLEDLLHSLRPPCRQRRSFDALFLIFVRF